MPSPSLRVIILLSILSGIGLVGATVMSTREVWAYDPKPAVLYPEPGVIRYLDVTIKDTNKGRQRYVCVPEAK